MGTKTFNNYEDLLTFTRASKGHALRPVSYGAELVTNGTFDSDTSGWTAGNNAVLSVSSNRLRVGLNVTDFAYASQSFATEAGKIYLITFNSWGSNQPALWRLGTSLTSNNVYQSVSKSDDNFSWHLAFVAQSDTTFLTLYANSTSDTGYAEYDNVSVKEVTFDESDGTLTLFEHPDNIPRVEWDADRNRLGLLVEEARTNLVTQSEDLSNAEWTKVNSSITANAITAPDGTLTADFLVPDTSAANHLVRDNISVGASQHSFSVYLKRGGYIWAALVHVDGDINTYTQWFNLETGTLGSGDATGSITDVGNGWYRCSITPSSAASATNASNQFIYVGEADNDAFFAGDGTSGIYAWGAQLEAGGFPTSYIKTTGSTATRSAELADVSVDTFGYNNSNEGTFVIHAKNLSYNPNGTGYPFLVRFDNATNSNDRLGIFLSETSGNLVAEIKRNNVTQMSPVFKTATGGAVDEIVVAFAFAEDDFAVSDDGDSVITDTAGTLVPSKPIAKIGLGQAFNSVHMNAHITSFKYYPRRLTNAQIEELSS